jgi:hypothetical protein
MRSPHPYAPQNARGIAEIKKINEIDEIKERNETDLE